MEVKVIGKPKPKVKWLRDDEQIFASEEYQIENFEDGTSVLVINHVYPDDLGTISFEAYNPLGVAVTTALFAVEGTVMAYHLFFHIEQFFIISWKKDLELLVKFFFRSAAEFSSFLSLTILLDNISNSISLQTCTFFLDLYYIHFNTLQDTNNFNT